jgi:hypothetical protein
MIKRTLRFFKNIINPPQFIVTIKNGRAEATFMKVKKIFLDECNEICRNCAIDKGKIYGVNSEYGVRLEFSEEISEEFHQKFRNVWNIVK